MSKKLSDYFSKESPKAVSPERTGAKRGRFLFNAKSTDKSPPASPPPKRAKRTVTPPSPALTPAPAATPQPTGLLSRFAFTKKSGAAPASPPAKKAAPPPQESPESSNPFSRLKEFAHQDKPTTTSPFKATKPAAKNQKKNLVVKKANIKAPKKFSPMEKQILALWKKHPGVILAVEVGYKVLFFGDDAIKASQVLNFLLVPRKGTSNFCRCFVPLVTFHIHLHRLVRAGLKVGVVVQTETRALKKAGDNRNAPFERELSQIYTKGTFISPKVDMVTEMQADDRNSGSADSGFLLSFCESDETRDDPTKKTTIGMLAVNVCTGQILWDQFEDEPLRPELENRLASIRPTEMILPPPESLSANTEKLIQHYYKAHTHAITNTRRRGHAGKSEEGAEAGDMVDDADQTELAASTDGEEATSDANEPFIYNETRIERAPFNPRDTTRVVQEFYDHADDVIQQFPSQVICCLGQMIDYLRAFSLEKLLTLVASFKPYAEDNFVPLDRCMIEQLELMESAEGSKKHNLFWLIDLTKTSFGSRLLRSWLLRPLKSASSINERLQAVSEILEHGKDSLERLLIGVPDLERGICRLFYNKCEPLEYITIMNAFLRVFRNMDAVHGEAFASPLLQRTLAAIPDCAEQIASWLACLSSDAAKAGRMCDLFQTAHLAVDPYPEITATNEAIALAESKLNDTLAQLRSDTGLSRLKYSTVAKEEYLVEVTHKEAQTVPPDWILVNKTKAAKRFRTPRIMQQQQILCQNRERLEEALKKAWHHFVEQTKAHYYELRQVVTHLALLDCLLAFATRGGQSNYVRPTITNPSEEDATIEIVGGRHPIVETFLQDNSFVPNETHLSGPRRCMVLTGPNMGGKSCYMKQVALIVLLAQIGSFVPATSATLSPVDRIMVRMGAQDCMEQGKSTFFVEMKETSEILRRATSRSLVLLDELGRGTSTHDGVAIADATLRHLITRTKCFTIFVTHYHLLCQTVSQFPLQAGCFHMGFFENQEEDNMESAEFSITFLYQLVSGMASRSFGMNVARLARIPESILSRAAEQSDALAQSTFLVDTTSERNNHRVICELAPPNAPSRLPVIQSYEALCSIWQILTRTNFGKNGEESIQ